MKIKCIKENNFICYINKYYYNFDEKTLNNFLMNLIKKIKKKYNIEVYGNYDIKCYIDKSYGIILDIKKEIDEFTKYTRKANLNIEFIDDKFLFEIDDYFLCKNYKKIIKYNDKYYIELSDYSSIMEDYNRIIYGDEKLLITSNN